VGGQIIIQIYERNVLKWKPFVPFVIGHEGKHDVAWRRGGPQNAWVGKSSLKSPREVFSNASLQERHQLGVVEVGLFFVRFPLLVVTKENMM
jgi:hypothetical protein